MTRIFFLFLIYISLLSCSFDNRSGIWNNPTNSLGKKDPLKSFKKIKVNQDIIFNKTLELKKDYTFNINSSKPNKFWRDKYYNSSNNYENFYYKDRGETELITKKLSRYNVNDTFLLEDNKMFFSDVDGNIIIYSLNEKKILKKFNFYRKKFKNQTKNLSISTLGQIMYISDNLGYIYAYDYKKNKIVWAINNKVPLRSNLKVTDDKLIVADQDNNLLIIDRNAGEIIKKFPTEDVLIKNNFKNNISLSDKNIFFLNTFGSIYSISLEDLKIKWFINLQETFSNDLSNLFNSQVIVYHNEKLVISTNFYLYILDSKNGATLQKIAISSNNQPIVSGNHIFLVTKNNLLVCVNIEDGDIIYSFNINQKISDYLKIKSSKVNIVSNRLVNNHLYFYLDNSHIIKFYIYGEIKDIIKLPKKILLGPSFVNSLMYYIDTRKKLVVIN